MALPKEMRSLGSIKAPPVFEAKCIGTPAAVDATADDVPDALRFHEPTTLPPSSSIENSESKFSNSDEESVKTPSDGFSDRFLRSDIVESVLI